eukprot:9478528-Pyramimonas_sp.AAC.1
MGQYIAAHLDQFAEPAAAASAKRLPDGRPVRGRSRACALPARREDCWLVLRREPDARRKG